MFVWHAQGTLPDKDVLINGDSHQKPYLWINSRGKHNVHTCFVQFCETCYLELERQLPLCALLENIYDDG